MVHGGWRAGQRRHGRPLGPREAWRPAAARCLGQGRLPAGFFVAAAQLAHRLPAQARGLTGRLLADASGQRQQGLGAAHRPHGVAAFAGEGFERGPVSSRQEEGSERSGHAAPSKNPSILLGCEDNYFYFREQFG